MFLRFYVSLTVHLVNKNQLGAQFIFYIFVNLFVFRATVDPSSGETAVFLRHLVLVILCGCMSGLQVASKD